MTAANRKQQLLAFGNPLKAEHAKYFFKTGEGQYGEGDRSLLYRLASAMRPC